MVAEPGAQFGISLADRDISSLKDLREDDVISISTPEGVITAKVITAKVRGSRSKRNLGEIGKNLIDFAWIVMFCFEIFSFESLVFYA